ncbi:MAG TPA: TonB-dependent receptor, partial [Kofleriaceae bacterium]|nr:TonB-dependent receptor [Kofleriaceae bacterium]
EVIVVEDRGTMIDPTSSNQGTVVTQDQMRNIPVPGRTFSSTLGQAPGSAGDSRGVGFSGSTSLENQYVIDGVNTTGLTYGTVGTPLINEFIEEIQILTGGYEAEYGRATGGVVNVITKSGSNEFHGSVFSTIVPYQANRSPVRPVSTAIEGIYDLDYSADLGFDLGGPIVKDKVWFYLGFAPQLARTNVSRVVRRFTDCRETMPDGTLSDCVRNDDGTFPFADGVEDTDPATDLPILEDVDKTQWKTSQSVYQFLTKINFALRPEHQGQVSLVGAPAAGEGLFGVTGAPNATRADFTSLNTDLAVKWTSKFDNNKTELEVVGGWHRDKYDQDSLASIADTLPTTRVYFGTLSNFGRAGNETAQARNGCHDSSSLSGGDPYPAIDNCPVFSYWLDSPGFTIDNKEDRRTISAKLTRRAELGGTHVIKGGADVENNLTFDVRHYTGGQYNQLILGGYDQVRIYRLVHADAGDDICGFDEDNNPRPCDYLDHSGVTGNTLNWSTFLQDSWQPRPNLTVNLGVRYEEQRLRYAEHLRGTIDPFTMEPLGKNAIRLRGMFAPRAGVVYDWTKEGRSKVFAHVGRFYESIPMALNDYGFSGDTTYGVYWGFDQCRSGSSPSPDDSNAAPSPYNCPTTPQMGVTDIYRGGTTIVTPGTKAQYLDEIVAGSEYELLEDLNVGLSVKQRRLGRVLEDISTDYTQTYVIGNPGYFSSGDEQDLLDHIDSLDPVDDADEIARLQDRLASFRAIRRFDKPERNYTALELTAQKRFSRNFYIQSSYTYARTRGNYPGLVNDDAGEALPNFSTQYDIAELLANQYGPLPQDRPHYFKFDGYYTYDLKAQGRLTGGVRFRAFSGTPRDALGANDVYGFDVTELLPRGSQGRNEFVTGTDLHASYERTLARGYDLAGFIDVINLFNQEQTAFADESYTFDNSVPIVGGDRTDLVFAKKLDDSTGEETPDPMTRNKGYGAPLARYTPLYIRFGLRLSF